MAVILFRTDTWEFGNGTWRRMEEDVGAWKRDLAVKRRHEVEDAGWETGYELLGELDVGKVETRLIVRVSWEGLLGGMAWDCWGILGKARGGRYHDDLFGGDLDGCLVYLAVGFFPCFGGGLLGAVVRMGAEIGMDMK